MLIGWQWAWILVSELDLRPRGKFTNDYASWSSGKGQRLGAILFGGWLVVSNFIIYYGVVIGYALYWTVCYLSVCEKFLSMAFAVV